MVRRRWGNLPSKVRRAAPPGGRGRSGAGRSARCGARWAHRTPARAGGVRQQGPGGASKGYIVRGGTLLFARWPTGAGWGGGEGSQEIEA